MSTPMPARSASAPSHLGLRLAHAQDEPGLGGEPGRLGPGQDGQAPGVAGRWAHRPLQASHGLQVVVEDVRRDGEQHVERGRVALGVADERLDRSCRAGAAGWPPPSRPPAPGRRRAGRPGPPWSARRGSRPRRSTASATRSGSEASTASGLRVSIRQKPQARVQRSPSTMNVAVPSAQHSDRFGQPASSQTVTRSSSRTARLRARTSSPVVHLGTQPVRLPGGDLQAAGHAGLGQAAAQVLRRVPYHGARSLPREKAERSAVR